MAANKHTTVTAQSLVRRAKEHKIYATSHRTVARDKGVTHDLQILHRAIAITHEETGAILREEARKLRQQR